MKRRRLVHTLGVAVILGALTACAQTGVAGTPGSTANTPAGVTTITYWHTYSADSKEVSTLETEVIPAFEKANPGIKVKDVAVPYNDMHQKLVTGVAGGELPDLVRADIIWVPELANLGVLEPLDTAMSDFGTFKDAVYPGPLATNAWKGHYFGLPLDTNTLVQLYNPKLLKSVGASAPASMDDLKALAAKLVKNGKYAYADNDLKGWNTLPFIWSFGGDITDPTVTKASGYVNSEATVNAITFLYQLYKEGAIPKFVTQSGATQTNDGFAKGQYATILGGPWMYPLLAGSNPDFAFSATKVPAGSAGSISVVGGENLVLTSSSTHKDAAMTFMRYLMSEDAQTTFAKVGQFSVLKSLGDKMTGIQPYYKTFVEQIATSRPRPATPAWSEIDAKMSSALQEAYLGNGDIKGALDKLAPELDALLAKYN